MIEMTEKEKNIFVYNSAYRYLEKIKPVEITNEMLEKYFVGDRRDFDTVEDIFEQIIQSAQNYQRMPNVIKYESRREDIRKILYNFDLDRLSQFDVEKLYQIFRREFDVTILFDEVQLLGEFEAVLNGLINIIFNVFAILLY